jgi:hypothetical protein
MKTIRTSEYNFSRVVCTAENGTENLRGSIVLTSSKLLFVSNENIKIGITLESITKLQGRRSGLQPSLEIEWDEGVISHRTMFSQNSSHFYRNDNITAIPSIVRQFRIL